MTHEVRRKENKHEAVDRTKGQRPNRLPSPGQRPSSYHTSVPTLPREGRELSSGEGNPAGNRALLSAGSPLSSPRLDSPQGDLGTLFGVLFDSCGATRPTAGPLALTNVRRTDP